MKFNQLTKFLAIPAMACFISASAFAADTNTDHGSLSMMDYKFAKTAAVGGMFEVNAGNIAAANSSNPVVQQFGQQMVKDHGKAGDELKTIASSKGATLPMELPSAKQKELDKLTALHGTDFDKAYVDCMLKAHKMDEKLFKHASEEAKDSDLKNFAGSTLAVVQSHLQMVQSMHDTMKSASTK